MSDVSNIDILVLSPSFKSPWLISARNFALPIELSAGGFLSCLFMFNINGSNCPLELYVLVHMPPNRLYFTCECFHYKQTTSISLSHYNVSLEVFSWIKGLSGPGRC